MRTALLVAVGFAAGALVALFLRPRYHSPPLPALQQVPAPPAAAASSAPSSAHVPQPASTPAATVTAPAAPAEATPREQIQQQQIAALQARVRELEATQQAELRRDQDSVAPRGKFHGFTGAELQAMAQNCEVRYDLPRLSREPFRLSPQRGAQLHLSDAEQEQVNDAMTKLDADVMSHLRAFYLEATGDANGADSLDALSLMREIMDKSLRTAVVTARAEIARERAGLAPSPSGTIIERYLRYITGVGDSLQGALEPSLGAQHAAAIRDALAESTVSMNGCPN